MPMTLLDTCALLWLVSDQERLSTPAKANLSANADALFVSAISAFEIGLLVAKDRIRFAMPVQDWFEQALTAHGLRELPLDAKTALYATQLPRLHNDPADRLLIAAAMMRDMVLLSPDPLIRQYTGVAVVW